MLDILIAIIEELFGNKQKPAERPRRPGRPADGGVPARTTARRTPAERRPEAPDGGFAGFEDMVRRMLGGEETEAEETPPPPPPPEIRPLRREAPALAAAAPPPVAPSGAAKTYHQPPAPLREPDGAVIPRAPAKAAPLKSAELPEFVRKLRNNPRAAREALVYAEIFGPPLADR